MKGTQGDLGFETTHAKSTTLFRAMELAFSALSSPNVVNFHTPFVVASKSRIGCGSGTLVATKEAQQSRALPNPMHFVRPRSALYAGLPTLPNTGALHRCGLARESFRPVG